MKPGPRQRLVLEAVATARGCTVKDLLQKGTRGPVGVARQAAMAELYATGRYSLPKLGQLFGVDHTAILHGIRRHKERMGIIKARANAEAAERRRKAAARKNLAARLAWSYGRTRARDIMAGQDQATRADLAAWNALGRAVEFAA